MGISQKIASQEKVRSFKNRDLDFSYCKNTEPFISFLYVLTCNTSFGYLSITCNALIACYNYMIFNYMFWVDVLGYIRLSAVLDYFWTKITQELSVNRIDLQAFTLVGHPRANPGSGLHSCFVLKGGVVLGIMRWVDSS